MKTGIVISRGTGQKLYDLSGGLDGEEILGLFSRYGVMFSGACYSGFSGVHSPILIGAVVPIHL